MSDVQENRFKTKNVVINMIWKLLERGSSVVITLAVNIVLAWLLEPEVHGLLALVTVFVTVSEIFVTAGMSGALTQKKDADELDFSTMFWMNLCVSFGIYTVLFGVSPLIAEAFGYKELCWILRVLSIRVIIASINSIQCAYIARNMLFKYYFVSTLSGKIVSGIIGITLALLDAGVWALVIQAVSLLLIETCVLWFRVKWRPVFLFSWKRGKRLYSFAWRVMLTSFVECITDQARNLMIGKKYTSTDLGFYNKGFLFPSSLTTNITSAISGVMFPVLSDAQEEIDKVKQLCRNWIGMFCYILFPMLLGLACVSDALIPLILSKKWIPAIPYVKIACGIYMSWIVEVPVREAIRARGFANIGLRIQIIKAVVSLLILLVTLEAGVDVIAHGALLCAIINMIISVCYANKYIGYKFREFINDIGGTIVISVTMGLVVMYIGRKMDVTIIRLVVQVTVGITTYILLSLISNNKHFFQITNLVKGKRTK